MQSIFPEIVKDSSFAVVIPIAICLFVTVLLLGRMTIMSMLLKLEAKMALRTRQEIPPAHKVFLSRIFGKKTPKEIITGNEKKPKISILVENFRFTPQEKEEFQKLCEFITEKKQETKPSASMMQLFPHVLGQNIAVSLMLHPHFPVSMIGALHLRSYFEILREDLLQEFLSASNPDGFSMEVKFWGGMPNQKKGSDLVCTLEIIHNPSSTPIWKEIQIVYSTNSVRQTDAVAKEILDEYSKRCDFTNLEASKTQQSGQISCTKAETWRFGELSSDRNPIHMSEIGARLFGQKGRIAHGAMILGKALAHLQQRQQLSIPSAFGVSFKGPVPCGSTLNVNITKKGEQRIEDCDLYCVKSDRPNICIRTLREAAK